MAKYLIKAGHNQPLVDLLPMTPQPRSPGVKPTRRTHAADSSVHDEALYIELAWSTLGTPTIYATLLTQFGLASVASAPVTVYVPNQRYVFTRYNGTAILPEGGDRRSYFIRDVVIVVKDLVVP